MFSNKDHVWNVKHNIIVQHVIHWILLFIYLMQGCRQIWMDLYNRAVTPVHKALELLLCCTDLSIWRYPATVIIMVLFLSRMLNKYHFCEQMWALITPRSFYRLQVVGYNIGCLRFLQYVLGENPRFIVITRHARGLLIRILMTWNISHNSLKFEENWNDILYKPWIL